MSSSLLEKSEVGRKFTKRLNRYFCQIKKHISNQHFFAFMENRNDVIQNSNIFGENYLVQAYFV